LPKPTFPSSQPSQHGALGVVRRLPNALEDAELVAGALRGERASKAAIFDRYGSLIQRIVVRTLGPDGEVEDVVHEVFIDAFASLSNLRDPSRLKSWLACIAVGRAKNVLRSRRRRPWWRVFGDDDVDQLEGLDQRDLRGQTRVGYDNLA